MIGSLIAWSLRNRFLVSCAVLFVIGFGIKAVYQTPVDAIPDLSENQVIVFADWAGRSPQEVEDQVTYPLSVNLQGLAGVRTVRATSMFGFSLVTVIFEDRIDNYFARQRILERLAPLDLLERQPSMGSPTLGKRIGVSTLRSWRVTGFPLMWFYIERDDHLDILRLLGERQDVLAILDNEGPLYSLEPAAPYRT